MDLSIVIPVYNSEKIIDDLIEKIADSISDIKLVNSYEIILVNDCSADSSWEKIKFLAKKFTFIKGINLSKNFGQHNAIMAGLGECRGETVITMDDDLQHSPLSIKNLLNEINKGFDVCYTQYLNRQHSLWKKFVSWLNNLVSSYLLNKPYNIYMSSYRAFKKKIVKEIITYDGSDVYIDGLILKSTRNISIVPVEHYKRPYGSSNYNFRKLLSLWSDMAVNFPIRPIRIATLFGIIIFIIIFVFRKIQFSSNKNKKEQYIILEKTY